MDIRVRAEEGIQGAGAEGWIRWRREDGVRRAGAGVGARAGGGGGAGTAGGVGEGEVEGWRQTWWKGWGLGRRPRLWRRSWAALSGWRGRGVGGEGAGGGEVCEERED